MSMYCTIDDITDQLRDYFNVKGDGGVLITEVVKESPAESHGLLAGDVIIKVNDQWISDTGELQESIRGFEPEEKVTITAVRKGREKSLNVTLGEMEAPQYAFHHFSKDKLLKDLHPPMGPHGNKMKWFMFDDDDLNKEEYFFQGHSEDIKAQLDELKKELSVLREELEDLRSK